MENKVEQTVRKYRMLSEKEPVIVGLSGGADSCALLHWLVMHGYQVIACHVNHMLRGEEADRDEHFTEKLCQQYGVKLVTLHADVQKEALSRHQSTELCGREIRYAFFQKLAEQYHAKIATAHTASDNAETVLFHLARGSGAAGLCGIPPVRGNIIRPLIECTRAEIEAYCNANHLSYVTDSTNLSAAYTRNRIRLEIIPKLKEINPSFESAVAGMTERMRQTVAFVTECAEKGLARAATDKGYDTAVLRQLEEAVLTRAIQLLCRPYVPEARHMALIVQMLDCQGAVELGKGVYVVCKQGFLRLVREAKHTKVSEMPWNQQDSFVIGDKKISLLKINIDDFYKNEERLFHRALDYDTIPVTSVFRTRRAGDSFCLPKRNVTKSVKKLFNEKKIPQEQRDHLLLLAEGTKVLWIEDIGAAQSCRVCPDTKKVLVINVKGR